MRLTVSERSYDVVYISLNNLNSVHFWGDYSFVTTNDGVTYKLTDVYKLYTQSRNIFFRGSLR